MGLFFQALQTAALQSGYSNYMAVPLLLTLEFKGHLNSVMQGIPANSLSIENTTKHIPLKIGGMEMKVTGKGAEYEVQAFPWNEQAFSASNVTLTKDTSISGKSVHELLQTGTESLQVVMNQIMQAAAIRENRTADQVLIQFPSDIPSSKATSDGNKEDNSSATTSSSSSSTSATIEQKLGVSMKSVKQGGNDTLVQDVATMNPLGKSSMGFNDYNKGDTPFSKDAMSYDESTQTYKRGDIIINPNVGNMKFAQGTSIINIINQVLLLSDYPRQALKGTQVSDSGKIPWWRVETQIYTIPADDNLKVTGTLPNLFVFRVVPYGIDASSFLPVNESNPNIQKAAAQALKEYNYIYTSKNLDVLNFDISFKAGFYQELNADVGQNTISKQTAGQSGTEAPDKASVLDTPTVGKAPTGSDELPIQRKATGLGSNTLGQGGSSSAEKPETTAARQAHDIFVNGVDMILTNMTILGDPYYLGDSGMGNYNAQKTNFENLNADQSMDYQNGEVDVIVNFRTPIDIDASKGAYTMGPTSLINKFSGLYKVLQVESKFSRGRFTQNLQLSRRIGQTGDVSSNATAVSAPASGKVTLLQGADAVKPAVYEPQTTTDDTNSPAPAN